ncbi:MAG: thrombospondin type 3 repeat-containing protein [Deltaproteobacteria bacterium]|nr:thrombospondin type 3 repeat-containing protein [Deltaproteobacteria bacterium]
MTARFALPGNWEVGWSTDPSPPPAGQGGRMFFSGFLPTPPWPEQTAGIYCERDGVLQPVVEMGGYPSGFAFDHQGNLWVAEAHIGSVPNAILMWTAAQIHEAVLTEVLLTRTEAVAMIETPDNLSGGDVVCDGAGNAYFSLNGGQSFIGQIVRIDHAEGPTWPGATTPICETKGYYDWQRSLAFDGSADVGTGGGVVFVDMDQATPGVTPPTLVGIAATLDTDADTIPDALDNCRQTANADQADADGDGIGDVCEGDCDGDGKVGASDLPYVAEAYGASGGVPETAWPADLDGDGDVDGKDLAGFACNLRVNP